MNHFETKAIKYLEASNAVQTAANPEDRVVALEKFFVAATELHAVKVAS